MITAPAAMRAPVFSPPRACHTGFVRRALHVMWLAAALLALGGCAGRRGDDVSAARFAGSVGGCNCPSSGTCADISYGDVPADGQYYVTTFGGGADTQGMSCGGTADGTWAYIADRARFGCDTKVRIEAGGKKCVALVADCGPNRCVEEAACDCGCGDHHPIIDASPFITEYLLGVSGAGYSDQIVVTATVVDPSSTVGCPGDEPATQQDAAVADDAAPAEDAGSEDATSAEAGAAPDGPGGADAASDGTGY
jgi:hypothetical protein